MSGELTKLQVAAILRSVKRDAEKDYRSLAQYDPAKAQNKGYIDGLDHAIQLLTTGEIQ